MKWNWKNWQILAAALALSFVLFANGIKGDFVYDDTLVLPGAQVSWSAVPGLFISPYHAGFPESGIYRPLTLVSFALNFLITGNSPIGFHTVNIILHGINIFLVFFLIERLARSRRMAVMGALLFAVLPIHIEAVTSIVGRGELSLCMFTLLALLYRDRPILSSIFVLGALASKETAVALVPLLVLFFWLVDNQNLKTSIKKSLIYCVPLGIYFALRYVALGRYIVSNNADIVYNPIKFAAFPASLWTAFKVLWLYLQKIFVPYNLASDYSYNQITIVGNLFHSLQALLGLGILGLLIYGITQKNKIIALSAALFLLPYFVISNLVYKTGTIMADRLMYIPSLGIVLLAVFGLDKLIQSKKYIAYGICGCVLIVYGGITIAHNQVWLTQESLSRDAYAKSPDSVLTKLGIAQVAMAHGQTEEAKTYLLSAESLYDKNVEVINLLGVIAWTQKDYPAAEKYFNQVLALRPHYNDALVNLSRVSTQEHNYDAAIRTLKTIIDQFGANAGYQNIRLLLYLNDTQGHYDDVITFAQELVNDQSSDDLRFLVGYAYLKKNDLTDARKYLNDLSPATLQQHLKTIGADFGN